MRRQNGRAALIGLVRGLSFGSLLIAISASTGLGQSRTAAPLARYLPAQDLVGLVEFDGIDAHADAWNKTAAVRAYKETKLGALIEDLVSQGLDLAFKNRPAGASPTRAQIIGLAQHVAHNGLAIGVRYKQGDREPAVVVVVRGAGRRPIRATFEALLGMIDGPNAERKTARKGTREVHIISPGQGAPTSTWWFEKEDLILCSPPAANADLVMAAIDGKSKSAADSANRAELTKLASGFQPFLVGFVDLTKLPPLPPQAAALGLGGVKRVDLSWGVQDDALMSNFRVVAPTPRSGLLALFDGQPTFDTAGIPAFLNGSTDFTVASVKVDALFERILALAQQTDPQAGDRVAATEKAFRDRFGLELRRDVLKHMGPLITFQSRTRAGAGIANPLTGGMTPLSDYALTMQVDDAAAARRAVDKLIDAANKALQANGQPGGPKWEIARLAGDPPGYSMAIPQGLLPPGLGLDGKYQPTLLVGPKALALASTSDLAKQTVRGTSSTGRWTPDASSATLAKRLPAKMVLLNVSDPRTTMIPLIEGLPQLMAMLNAQAQGNIPIKIDPMKVPSGDSLRKLLFPASVALSVDDRGWTLVSRESLPSVTSPASAGVLTALLLPAVQAAREAARRAQCTNNEKQIALALHNYHQANDRLPPPAIYSKDGKPLLSWRVALLPYLEQQGLYQEFHLDEPWDSPHNKALIAKIPGTYLCPSRANVEPGTTTYRAFTGKGSLFEGPKGVSFADIADGTSNTIAVAEFTDAVPWTKPDETPIDADGRACLAKLRSNHPGGLNAMFADGSVRFLKLTINPQTLRALLTRNGGEVVGQDGF